MAKTPMTPKAAAKIQSATAKANGGSVPKGSFAARAQRAAAKNSSFLSLSISSKISFFEDFEIFFLFIQFFKFL